MEGSQNTSTSVSVWNKTYKSSGRGQIQHMVKPDKDFKEALKLLRIADNKSYELCNPPIPPKNQDVYEEACVRFFYDKARQEDVECLCLGGLTIGGEQQEENKGSQVTQTNQQFDVLAFFWSKSGKNMFRFSDGSSKFEFKLPCLIVAEATTHATFLSQLAHKVRTCFRAHDHFTRNKAPFESKYFKKFEASKIGEMANLFGKKIQNLYTMVMANAPASYYLEERAIRLSDLKVAAQEGNRKGVFTSVGSWVTFVMQNDRNDPDLLRDALTVFQSLKDIDSGVETKIQSTDDQKQLTTPTLDQGTGDFSQKEPFNKSQDLKNLSPTFTSLRAFKTMEEVLLRENLPTAPLPTTSCLCDNPNDNYFRALKNLSVNLCYVPHPILSSRSEEQKRGLILRDEGAETSKDAEIAKLKEQLRALEDLKKDVKVEKKDAELLARAQRAEKDLESLKRKHILHIFAIKGKVLNSVTELMDNNQPTLMKDLRTNILQHFKPYQAE